MAICNKPLVVLFVPVLDLEKTHTVMALNINGIALVIRAYISLYKFIYIYIYIYIHIYIFALVQFVSSLPIWFPVLVMFCFEGPGLTSGTRSSGPGSDSGGLWLSRGTAGHRVCLGWRAWRGAGVVQDLS